MIIKVLGLQHSEKCSKLMEIVKQVVAETKITAEIFNVYDEPEYMKYGVFRTPALVVNEKVKFIGRVPGYNEVMRVILLANDNTLISP